LTELAVRQIQEIAGVSMGAVEFIESRQEAAGLVVDISLDTRRITTRGAGIKVRNRERFQLVIPETYPYRPPSVWVSHRRWAGRPHVQWGRFLCLYAAPAVEWNPAEGMRGLIDLLVTWLTRAAEGTLDPDDQPLHPPVTYTSTATGRVIVHPDVADLVPWGDTVTPGRTRLLYAWCQRNGNRIDIREWLIPDEAYDRVLDADFNPVDVAGRPHFVAPLIVVSDELSMEYPDNAAALVGSLEDFGFPRDAVLRAIASARTFNGAIASFAATDSDAPVVVLLGTPARRVAGTRRLTHLTAWKLDDLGSQISELVRGIHRYDDELAEEVRSLANKWINIAEVDWMAVYENRPEVTNRRDAASSAAWLQGKRVLVLGCGALGAPIAEHCVRAGVSALTVVDDGTVKPGILVRQPYYDADISHAKARRLADRLSEIRPDLKVQALARNAFRLFTGELQGPPDYDLIVDASANTGVRAAIESARAACRDDWPPLITGLFGHDAQRGLGVLSRPGSTGGAHDILRRIAIDARGHACATWRDVADDFFPDPARTQMFFPEPGCSAPTFTGSAIQTEALASALLWSLITELADELTAEPMEAAAIRLAGIGASDARASRLSWPNDHVQRDLNGRYEVRVSARALAEMRAETCRGPERGDRRSRRAACSWEHSTTRSAASTSTRRRGRRPTVSCRPRISITARSVLKSSSRTIRSAPPIALASSECGTPTRTGKPTQAPPTRPESVGSCRPTAPVDVRSCSSSAGRASAGTPGANKATRQRSTCGSLTVTTPFSLPSDGRGHRSSCPPAAFQAASTTLIPARHLNQPGGADFSAENHERPAAYRPRGLGWRLPRHRVRLGVPTRVARPRFASICPRRLGYQRRKPVSSHVGVRPE
jgi:hypothetical protein